VQLVGLENGPRGYAHNMSNIWNWHILF
jgi:hypothetical protein